MTLESCCVQNIAKKIENEIAIWSNNLSNLDKVEESSAIFCIELAHLKWNAIPSEKNPGFQISELPAYKNSDQQWISDWKAYANPVIASLANLKNAIEYCEGIKNYEKQPWVKSDGYRSSTLDIHLAFLLVQDGQLEKALDILQAALRLQIHPPSIERHQKAFNWVTGLISVRDKSYSE